GPAFAWLRTRASPSACMCCSSASREPSVEPSSMKMNSRAKSPRWLLSPAMTWCRKRRLLNTGMTKLTPFSGGPALMASGARRSGALHHDVAGKLLDAGELDHHRRTLLLGIGPPLGLGNQLPDLVALRPLGQRLDIAIEAQHAAAEILSGLGGVAIEDA